MTPTEVELLVPLGIGNQQPWCLQRSQKASNKSQILITRDYKTQ